jgi:hypothetical protein
MGIEKDVIALIKAEGLKVNETIRDALDEFIDIAGRCRHRREADVGRGGRQLAGSVRKAMRLSGPGRVGGAPTT